MLLQNVYTQCFPDSYARDEIYVSGGYGPICNDWSLMAREYAINRNNTSDPNLKFIFPTIPDSTWYEGVHGYIGQGEEGVYDLVTDVIFIAGDTDDHGLYTWIPTYYDTSHQISYDIPSNAVVQMALVPGKNHIIIKNKLTEDGDVKLWLPNGLHSLFNDNPDASYNEAGNFLSITSTQNNGDRLLEKIKIYSNLDGLGEYLIEPNINNSIVIFDKLDTIQNKYVPYYLDTSYYNFISIQRLDTIQDIVSGIFEVQVINLENQDTLLINDGRFDLEYTY